MRIPHLVLIGREANRGRSCALIFHTVNKYSLRVIHRAFSPALSRSGSRINRNCTPASYCGTVLAGVAGCVAAGAAWGCSETADCAAEAVMGSTGRVSVCTVAGSSRSFR